MEPSEYDHTFTSSHKLPLEDAAAATRQHYTPASPRKDDADKLTTVDEGVQKHVAEGERHRAGKAPCICGYSNGSGGDDEIYSDCVPTKRR